MCKALGSDFIAIKNKKEKDGGLLVEHQCEIRSDEAKISHGKF